jgi:hypothetical protein
MKKEYLQCLNEIKEKVEISSNQVVKLLELDSPDPHIQELFESVALIQGCLKYEFEREGSKFLKKILYNLNLVKPLCAKAICYCDFSNDNVMIKEGTLLKAEETFFKTMINCNISPISIDKFEAVEDQGECFLNILFSIHGVAPNEINLFLNESLIKSIFFKGSSKVKAKLWNRTDYFTECECVWNVARWSLNEYFHFKEQFFFVSIQNIDSRALKNQFVLSIPLLFIPKNIQNLEIITNCLLVENKYNYSINLNVNSEGAYKVDVSNILNVIEISSNQNKIKNIVEDEKGWYYLDSSTIYFNKSYEEEVLLSLEVFEDLPNRFFNEKISLYFEEFMGINEIHFLSKFVKTDLQNNKDSIVSIIEKMKANDFTSYFNSLKLDLKIIEIEETIGLELYKNNYIHKVLQTVHIKAKVDDVILFRVIFEETLKNNYFVKLKFHTPTRTIFFE